MEAKTLAYETHKQRFYKKKTLSPLYPTFITSPLLTIAVFRLLSFFLSLYLYMILLFLAISSLPTYYKFIFLLVFLSNFVLPHYFLRIPFFVRFYPISLFLYFFF